MERKKVELYKVKADCCACGACVNICPKHAISMQKDENGFMYPVIDDTLCIGCQACTKVCAFQNINEKKGAIDVYAAARNDEKKILKSTSGGIFAVFAEKVLEKQGIVYGATMEYCNQQLQVRHVGIETLEELERLQGSKYVQSDLGNVYSEVREQLLKGREVLFSGTPCQVAGLKAFLKREYNNLLTIDIICHGVPSNTLFQEHIKELEKKLGVKIEKYVFRNKENGWGLKSKIIGVKENGEKMEYQYNASELSYYSLFLDGYIYRENCYKCKYTNEYRPADITIGDYWGVGDIHPAYITDNGGKLEKKLGISTIILNSEHGKDCLYNVEEKLYMYESEFEKVASRNPQLRVPCKYPSVRNKIFSIYRNKGYVAVDKYAVRLNRRKENKRKIKELCKKIIMRNKGNTK